MPMKTPFDPNSLVGDAYSVRTKILEMVSNSAGGHHLGGGLSMVELMCYLYGFKLNVSPETTKSEIRDRFILSKGHGVLGLYPVLEHYRFIDESVLSSYKTFRSELIAHPIKNLDYGIESSNGSLGHGLSYAAGIAYALRYKNIASNVYVLMGDGECNEGSVWEAAMSAGSQGLEGLTAIVDMNGFQSDTGTSNINSECRIKDMFISLGWSAIEIDGHSFESIHSGFEKSSEGKPKVLLARTIKGKGFVQMENNNSFHHARITKNAYQEFKSELEQK